MDKEAKAKLKATVTNFFSFDSEDQRKELVDSGLATEVLLPDEPVVEFLSAMIKDKLYHKKWQKEQSQVPPRYKEYVGNRYVDQLLSITEELQDEMETIKHRIRKLIYVAIANSSDMEAQQLFHGLYWGYRLSYFDVPWFITDHELMLGGFLHDGFPHNEEEWQKEAGPLEYDCECENCGSQFKQSFASIQDYDRECSAIGGTRFGLVIDLCQSCKHDLPKKSGHVYLLQSSPGTYKIGRTKDPKDRLRTFEVKLPFEAEYVCTIKTYDMFRLERELHEKFADKRIRGEWFALRPEDVEYIKQIRHF